MESWGASLATGGLDVRTPARADAPRGTGLWPGARHTPLAHNTHDAWPQTGGHRGVLACVLVRTTAEADAARLGATSRVGAFWLPSNSKCHCLTETYSKFPTRSEPWYL
jgi:hypothetical protein